jgi:hypothetical protein
MLLLFVVLGSSMAVFGVAGFVVFLLVVALAVYVRESESPYGLLRVVIALICLAGLIALLMPAVQSGRETGRNSTCRSNLKQIALALLFRAESKCSFPQAYTVDSGGKPMHSWRTQILPDLERNDLYTACDFTRPWDAPKNKMILTKTLRAFICPSDPPDNASGAGQTNYFAVVGPNTAWPGSKARSLVEIGEQTHHTILLVEAADSGVAWAEPKDFSLNTLGTTGGTGTLRLSSNHRPSESFFYTFSGTGVNIALADGSVTFLRTDNLSPDELRDIFRIGGFTDDVIARQTDLYPSGHLNWPNIAALAVWLVSVGTLLTSAVRGRKARPKHYVEQVQ